MTMPRLLRMGLGPTMAGIALAAALLLSGCKKSESADDASDTTAVSVKAAHAPVGPLSQEIIADAILAPLAQAAIASRVSAPISAEYVQRGAHVRKGQLLLTLENRDVQGAALDSKGSFAQAQAAYTTAVQATVPEDVQKARLDVDQAKANLDVANRTADERKRLLREGAIAGRDTDTAIAAAVQAQAAYDIASKHLASVQDVTRGTSLETAQGQLTSARGRLVNAEAQLSYTRLVSPIKGVVTERPLFPGETAAAGTPVITVMDTSSLLAKLHLAQSAAQQLRLGATAEVHVPGVEDAQEATVSFISPALDPGSATVEVWLKLDNAGGQYKVGSPVRVVINGATVSNAVQVPPSAILPADDGSTMVLVVDGTGAVHKRPVKVGLRTSAAVQIVEGVSQGETVVTDGGYGLDDGTKVKLGDGDDSSEDKNADAPKRGSKAGRTGSKKNGGKE